QWVPWARYAVWLRPSSITATEQLERWLQRTCAVGARTQPGKLPGARPATSGLRAKEALSHHETADPRRLFPSKSVLCIVSGLKLVGREKGLDYGVLAAQPIYFVANCNSGDDKPNSWLGWVCWRGEEPCRRVHCLPGRACYAII